jgi:hypothetical protein
MNMKYEELLLKFARDKPLFVWSAGLYLGSRAIILSCGLKLFRLVQIDNEWTMYLGLGWDKCYQV